ncbi:MAG TPA: DUF6596 domain-containing protein [bacterium]|nr:DUF6596 domain-containing protein [bacterium]
MNVAIDAHGGPDTHRAVERAARESYGRLLAFLASRTRDVEAAEDALADAFTAALTAWPRTGVPEKPEAWLLTAARRRLIDAARRAGAEARVLPVLLDASGEAERTAAAASPFPDERLELLFLCAHPAIDEAVRAPLMLQTVLGLDASRIASAFLAKPSTMGQRLSRAKAKIRDAGMHFEVPAVAVLPERLGAVLQAIYAAYGSGWEDLDGADPRRRGLAAEAIEVGRVLHRLLPAEPEVSGLLALILYCEARRSARRDAAGTYVPLSEQDVTRWSRPMIIEAEGLLSEAARATGGPGRSEPEPGRFQLEAAIQSVHARRAVTGATDWEAIALLYEGLARAAPTVGVLVGRAAAVAEAHGPARGWALLEELPRDAVERYQPYWALAAYLLTRLGRLEDAARAYERAIGLCEDPSAREYLVGQRRALAVQQSGR